MSWLRIENQVGDICFVPTNKLSPISRAEAKQHKEFLDSKIRDNYPLFVDGLLMSAPKSCYVKDWSLFKAVVTGHQIDLQKSK